VHVTKKLSLHYFGKYNRFGGLPSHIIISVSSIKVCLLSHKQQSITKPPSKHSPYSRDYVHAVRHDEAWCQRQVSGHLQQISRGVSRRLQARLYQSEQESTTLNKRDELLKMLSAIQSIAWRHATHVFKLNINFQARSGVSCIVRHWLLKYYCLVVAT